MQRTAGIHHVTAIASDPQRNLDFYAGLALYQKLVTQAPADAPALSPTA